MTPDVAPPLAAPQQSRAPRPLPLFLALVRDIGERDPDLARAALAGLRRYGEAPAPSRPPSRDEVARSGGARLLDCGGSGAPLILVPSPINSPDILDLDPDCSLAAALGSRRRVLLLDWGDAGTRATLDLDGHVEALLLPILESVGPAVLAGYCLGGTLATIAAQRMPDRVRALITLASPWDFSAYPADARARLLHLWRSSEAASESLGLLPMEILQSAFWALDPEHVVAKYARFAATPPASPQERRFVTLETWANGGEPLPLPAARQLVECWFGGTGPGGTLPDVPILHVTATADRIVPATSAALSGDRLACPAGHVGMIVGRDAPANLHAPLNEWLEGLALGR